MFLELAADAYIIGGKSLAWIYRKIWGRRRLKYFDHRFDHLRGPQHTCWQERGVLGALAIPDGGEVLDLCCGEGFYARYYYSSRASHVDAIDLDLSAIQIAKRYNRHESVSFYAGDVTAVPFPRSDYDTVIFFSALHCIPEEKRSMLMSKVASSLKPGGTLVGSASLPLGSIAELLAAHFEVPKLWVSDWGNGRMESYLECRRLR